ncbi:P-loop containing nucleoside triphosphate hydrolase protein [Kalaharituber pfeilii]|nr:P-loop containing nucleoside triphosphate hydrolase protein [Kalaharituber pfeilii]
MKRKHSDDTSSAPPTSLTTESNLDEETTFQNLGLDPRLLQGIAKLEFAHPTAVQAKAIPLALEGKDILARAKTGSGKTAAYLLPVLQSILKRKDVEADDVGPTALILVPTRELAAQVHKMAERLAAYCGKAIRVVNLAQNVSEQVQQSLLAESPEIVVATPSRALAHINHSPQSLSSHLTHLIIDEADLVLSYGYEDDLQAVAKALPKGLQTFLASATLTDEVDTLRKLFCRAPVILRVLDDDTTGSTFGGGLRQFVVRCAEDEKFLLLYVIFKLKLIKGKSIVFVGDIDRCYRVRLFLEQFGIRACVLNSELPVNSRLHIVDQFNKNVYDIIIATDENEVMGDEQDDDIDAHVAEEEADTTNAAKKQKKKKDTFQTKKNKPRRKRDKEYGISRGIDFQNVSCVLNFDLPTTSRSYTHRIGRTARAGRAGMALSFVVPANLFGKHKPTTFAQCENDEKVLARIQRHQRKRAGLPSKPKAGEDPVATDVVKPYVFDMKQVDAFRYRMEDALRAVTKVKIREARLAELRNELVKSEKLKRWFEENPGELKALRHDTGSAAGAGVRVLPHLKHVPDYLLPKREGLVTAGGERGGREAGVGVKVGFRKETENRIRRARMMRRKGGGGKGGGKGGKGKGSRDPLRTFKTKR